MAERLPGEQQNPITVTATDEITILLRYREIKRHGHGEITVGYHQGTYQVDGGKRDRGSVE